MKKYLPTIISSIIFLAIGYFVGGQQGYNNRDNEQRFKTIDQLKFELKDREKESILSLVESKGEVNKRDEGGLFSVDYVHYLTGTINNNAAVATIKDIKFRVDYLSKTSSKVGTEEVTIFEFIKPGQSHYNYCYFYDETNLKVGGNSFYGTDYN
jgi:hypothetical protein